MAKCEFNESDVIDVYLSDVVVWLYSHQMGFSNSQGDLRSSETFEFLYGGLVYTLKVVQLLFGFELAQTILTSHLPG
jgi:hypothetical protein